MLWIDFIDIIYLAVGILIGATIQAYLDSCTCDECERSNNEKRA